MDTNTLANAISRESGLPLSQIQAVIALSGDGCTIPFIARYRKEMTNNADEVVIHGILSLSEKITALEKRREYILSTLAENNTLTDELAGKIRLASSLPELEDLYLPFKPRRRTLADRARELGLEPLARSIEKKNPNRAKALSEAQAFINDDVPDAESALKQAMDILVQETSDSPAVRSLVRASLSKGNIRARMKKGMEKDGEKYRDYFDFREAAGRIASHRLMALSRAENEKVISLAIEPVEDGETLLRNMTIARFERDGELLREACHESLKRHLMDSISNEVFARLKEKAETASLEIFARNLERILLFPPFGEKTVMGVDPGIRTGCKVAVIDSTGAFVESITVYLHSNPDDAMKLVALAGKHSIKGISVGRGTYGREAYAIIKNAFRDTDVVIAAVDEDGASVYSADEVAREEFPDLDVTVRGAISIGRRFQDPMAELVKIDPKSLGVGQYQHDIPESLLKNRLAHTVEWAVNRVGVNLNTAGYHLLAHISGLDRKKAAEIVRIRTEKGKIRSREELKLIKGIGEKVFQQCAGFLRIIDGENELDSTGVHPESYPDVIRLAEFYGTTPEDLASDPSIVKAEDARTRLNIREIDSLLNELSRGGLDPRSEFTPDQWNEGIEGIDDLAEGTVLTGIIDNVAAFGAFVDLGIKEKGLVHISEVSDKYISNITDALSVGDRVTVKVLSVDRERKRIALSIKKAKEHSIQ